MGWVRATDNTDLDLNSLPQTYHRDASGNVDYIEVVHPVAGTYRQTLTWTAGVMTAASAWVKQ